MQLWKAKLELINYEMVPNLKGVQNAEEYEKIGKAYCFIPKLISSEVSGNLEKVFFFKKSRLNKFRQL